LNDILEDDSFAESIIIQHLVAVTHVLMKRLVKQIILCLKIFFDVIFHSSYHSFPLFSCSHDYICLQLFHLSLNKSKLLNIVQSELAISLF